MAQKKSTEKTTLEVLLDEYWRLGESEFRKNQGAAFLIAHHQPQQTDLGEEITTYDWNRPLSFSTSASGTEVYPLASETSEITIGRALSNDVVINMPKVSKIHALIRVDDVYRIQDLGSRNGTKLNGRRLEKGEWADLQSGNLVAFFDAVFVFASLDDLILKLTYLEKTETKKPASRKSGPSTEEE